MSTLCWARLSIIASAMCASVVVINSTKSKNTSLILSPLNKRTQIDNISLLSYFPVTSSAMIEKTLVESCNDFVVRSPIQSAIIYMISFCVVFDVHLAFRFPCSRWSFNTVSVSAMRCQEISFINCCRCAIISMTT